MAYQNNTPIPVQKLRDAKDLAASLSPSTLSAEAASAPVPDDGLTPEEKLLAISRLDHSGRTRTSKSAQRYRVGSKDGLDGASSEYTLHYGWVCQAGFYPEDMNKKNQDNLLVHTNFDEVASRAVFGVFDGHGRFGTECSTFAVNNLARNLVDQSEYPSDFDEAYRKAFIATNKKMHNAKKLRGTRRWFDDTHAGTTAICVTFDGHDVSVANVGDSRAVVAEERDGRLCAFPLSMDQTPYRKDERERCEDAGAVVMTMDQLEGIKPMPKPDHVWGTEEDDDGDPPRLWKKHSTGPGVAFTRSLGDSLAEEIGCNAEPELLRKELRPTDKFLVIASDGVWEFLSSQTVVDMVSKYDCPLQAAKGLVEEAYKLWLYYEVRTDDITAIVIFLEDLKDDKVGANESENNNRRGSAQGIKKGFHTMIAKEARPVRREMSRQKREMIERSTADDDDMIATPNASPRGVVLAERTDPKSEEELALLGRAVRANFLFQHLNPMQLQELFCAMYRVKIAAGEVVIKQGDAGDHFYVVHSGAYECFVDSGDTRKLVLTYTASSDAAVGNPSFGELALMYSKPRAATVVAKTSGELWRLDRNTFRRTLMKTKSRELVRTLRKVEILASLSHSQLSRLAEILTEVEYESGEVIVKQGDSGDTFYVVKEGEVRITINEDAPQPESTTFTPTEPSRDLAKVSPSPSVAHRALARGMSTRGASFAVKAVNPNFDPSQGVEVMRLSKHRYFGERALLRSEPRAASVLAVDKVKLLYISRQAFEEVLGPLSALIEDDGRIREQAALALTHAHTELVRLGIGDVALTQLTDCGVVSQMGIGTTMRLVRMKDGDGTLFTLKSVPRASVEKANQQAQVVRERALLLRLGLLSYNSAASDQAEVENTVSTAACTSKGGELGYEANIPEFFVGKVLATFVGPQSLHTLFASAVSGELHGFMAEPFDLGTACFIAASVVQLLEELHSERVVCRAVSPETLSVDSRGYVRLLDLRLGKQLGSGEDRTFTMCGSAAYLAPEQVKQTGHGLGADWWALGVLVYEMLHGRTPFDIEGGGSSADAELYKRIADTDTSKIIFAEGIHEDAADFVRQLLSPNSATRFGSEGGAAQVKSHKLLESIGWTQLRLGSVESPLAEAAAKAVEETQMVAKQAGFNIEDAHIPAADAWYKPFAE